VSNVKFRVADDTEVIASSSNRNAEYRHFCVQLLIGPLECYGYAGPSRNLYWLAQAHLVPHGRCS
jgi:hypothetical protein